MSVDGTDNEQPDPKLLAIYPGVVTRNDDPLMAGRVQVMIPGHVEPHSDWALPSSKAFGGSTGAGIFYVPKVGADVDVWFDDGDPDHPHYAIGGWGAPDGRGEIPLYARDVAPKDAEKVFVVQTERWEFVLDEREDKQLLRIRDLANPNDVVEIDGVNHGLTISGTVAVVIKSVGVVSIEGLQVQINKRIVRDTSEPI